MAAAAAAAAALQLEIRARRPLSRVFSRPLGGRWTISFQAEGGEERGPAAELVRALVACRGLCALLLTAEKTRERASPGLQRRGSGDEPDMERPPRGARSQPALRRGYRLRRGSAGLGVLGRPGEIPATASGKDGSPAGRTLQQVPY